MLRPLGYSITSVPTSSVSSPLPAPAHRAFLIIGCLYSPAWSCLSLFRHPLSLSILLSLFLFPFSKQCCSGHLCVERSAHAWVSIAALDGGGRGGADCSSHLEIFQGNFWTVKDCLCQTEACPCLGSWEVTSQSSECPT